MEKTDPKRIAVEMAQKYGVAIAIFVQKANIEKLAEYVIFSEYEDAILTELRKLL